MYVNPCTRGAAQITPSLPQHRGAADAVHRSLDFSSAGRTDGNWDVLFISWITDTWYRINVANSSLFQVDTHICIEGRVSFSFEKMEKNNNSHWQMCEFMFIWISMNSSLQVHTDRLLPRKPWGQRLRIGKYRISKELFPLAGKFSYLYCTWKLSGFLWILRPRSWICLRRWIWIKYVGEGGTWRIGQPSRSSSQRWIRHHQHFLALLLHFHWSTSPSVLIQVFCPSPSPSVLIFFYIVDCIKPRSDGFSINYFRPQGYIWFESQITNGEFGFHRVFV